MGLSCPIIEVRGYCFRSLDEVVDSCSIKSTYLSKNFAIKSNSEAKILFFFELNKFLSALFSFFLHFYVFWGELCHCYILFLSKSTLKKGVRTFALLYNVCIWKWIVLWFFSPIVLLHDPYQLVFVTNLETYYFTSIPCKVKHLPSRMM